MNKLLVSLLLLVSSVCTRAEIVTIQIPGAPPGLSITVGTGANALPLRDIRTNPNAVNISTSDDGWNNVPLGFDFPFYGRTFNNSWAMTNGVVTFQDPIQSGAYGLCCSGVDLTRTTDARYNYSIYGVHTDLYSWNGQNQYYLRENNNTMTYGWYNLSQCCSNQGGNSFEIKINSAGLVDTRIAGAMVQYNAVTSGMAGNLANGEYYQYYHGQGLNITPGSANIFSWQALNGTGAADMCLINPLSSPSCPGYQVAFTTQQCTISALYDPSCPGYQVAFTTQQCSVNPLYSQVCSGYQAAYLQQQCSINPLYSTTCDGYQRAYHDQQCSLNTLYATDCPGYAQAYLDQQCSVNPLYSTTCSGYQRAYHDQQCSINPLYMSDCVGYAVAYKAQQCSISALYASDCPGYAQAYFSQQCSLNGLYDKTCPNYSTAYATKMLLEQQNMASTVATAGVIASTAPQTTTTSTVSSDGTVSSTPTISSTGNATVDKAIAPQTTTANSAAAPAAPVQLVQAPPPAAAPQQQAQQEKPTDKPSANTPPPQQQAQSGGGNGEQPKPTARQEVQAKREAAAKAKAVEDGKKMASEIGKANDMEQQKQVQNVVIAAMGFTPGFDAYQVRMPDVAGYKPYSIYNNQKPVDNRRIGLGLFGPSDNVHRDMVDSQYNRKD